MKFDIMESKLYPIIRLIVDVFIIIFGYYISFFVRYGHNIQEKNMEPFFTLMPYIILASLFFFHIYLTDDNGDDSYFDTVISSLLAILMIQIATMAMSFFSRGFAFPRSIFAISFILHSVMIILWKKTLVYGEGRFGFRSKLLLIGDDEKNRNVMKNLIRIRNSRVEIAGEMKVDELLKYGIPESIDSICITGSIEGFYNDKVLEMAVANDKKIFVVPNLYEIILSNSKLSQFDDMPVLKVRRLSLTMEQRFIKRLIDLALVVPALVITSPFMIVASIMIKKNDGGPVFYKQERLTWGGKRFELIKFRTMIVNAEEKTGPVLAGTNDLRITKAGRLLRATRLDELPQLINVLKGDLSLVGPRAEREFFYEEFSEEIPQFKYRLSIKAGVTGLGQILGRYTTSPEDKLAYDLLYAYSYSVLLDIKIILRTIRIMMKASSSKGKN